MSCHYCDGVGYTIVGDDSGTWREPCPVCAKLDEHDRARARALADVDIDVRDAFG